MRRLLVDQLERAQLVDVRAHALARLRDALEQPQRELAADHRRHLDGEPGVVVQPIEARHQHVLDRVRHRDRARVARQHDPTVVAPQRAVLEERAGHLLDEERDCPPPWPR